jgi:hypothetical protein
MDSDEWTGKDVEESSHDLISGTILTMVWRELERIWKPQSRQPISSPRFKPQTSQT